MLKPYYEDSAVTIYHGDCREILPQLDVKVDLVLTDPPYPDDHLEYGDCDLSHLNKLTCRQFIFWSKVADFPLDFTAIHIWNKVVACGSAYERLFERHGHKNFKVFSYGLINSPVAAQIASDIFTGHESQKPIKLLKRLVADYTEAQQTILDPFLGSGTTAVAAKILGRRCIGIEIEEKYCEIAAKRLAQSVMKLEV